MREEISNWFKQAEADLKKAAVLYDSGDFDGTVFFCQQAAEKALKASCMKKLKETPKGHSILYLAKLVKAPGALFSGIRDLNPEYLISRYPDMAQGAPYELYDANIAERHKETAEEVLKWVRKQIRE